MNPRILNWLTGIAFLILGDILVGGDFRFRMGIWCIALAAVIIAKASGGIL